MARKKNGDAEQRASKIGHNSNLTDGQKVDLSGAVEEIERVEAEMSSLAGQKGAIYKRLKEKGFETTAIRHTVRLRKMEKSKRNEFEAAVDAYTLALGDFATTALGQAGRPRDHHA